MKIVYKIVAFFKSLFNWKQYGVDAGIIDFSGQGRNKYGK